GPRGARPAAGPAGGRAVLPVSGPAPELRAPARWERPSCRKESDLSSHAEPVDAVPLYRYPAPDARRRQRRLEDFDLQEQSLLVLDPAGPLPPEDGGGGGQEQGCVVAGGVSGRRRRQQERAD